MLFKQELIQEIGDLMDIKASDPDFMLDNNNPSLLELFVLSKEEILDGLNREKHAYLDWLHESNVKISDVKKILKSINYKDINEG